MYEAPGFHRAIGSLGSLKQKSYLLNRCNNKFIITLQQGYGPINMHWNQPNNPSFLTSNYLFFSG